MMNNACKSIYRLFIDEQLQFLELRAAEASILIIERGIALRKPFKLAEEVVDEMGKGNIVSEDDLSGCEEIDLLLLAAIELA